MVIDIFCCDSDNGIFYCDMYICVYSDIVIYNSYSLDSCGNVFLLALHTFVQRGEEKYEPQNYC